MSWPSPFVPLALSNRYWFGQWAGCLNWWRASAGGARLKSPDLARVPAIIREIPDDRLLEFALVENIQRQELNPIEEANAYKRLDRLTRTNAGRGSSASRQGSNLCHKLSARPKVTDRHPDPARRGEAFIRSRANTTRNTGSGDPTSLRTKDRQALAGLYVRLSNALSISVIGKRYPPKLLRPSIRISEQLK